MHQKRPSEQIRGENELSKIYYHAQEEQRRNVHNGAIQTDISGMPSREVEQQEETSARESLFADFRKQFAGDEEHPLEHGRQATEGSPLPEHLKERLEQGTGFSMDDVRIHYHSDKPAELGALAYTQGADIFIGPGQEKHLEHELGHVVQQKQGKVRPTTHIEGIPVNDASDLEMTAERIGQGRVPQFCQENCGEAADDTYNDLEPVVQRMLFTNIMRDDKKFKINEDTDLGTLWAMACEYMGQKGQKKKRDGSHYNSINDYIKPLANVVWEGGSVEMSKGDSARVITHGNEPEGETPRYVSNARYGQIQGMDLGVFGIDGMDILPMSAEEVFEAIREATGVSIEDLLPGYCGMFDGKLTLLPQSGVVGVDSDIYSETVKELQKKGQTDSWNKFIYDTDFYTDKNEQTKEAGQWKRFGDLVASDDTIKEAFLAYQAKPENSQLAALLEALYFCMRDGYEELTAAVIARSREKGKPAIQKESLWKDLFSKR